MTSTKKKLGLAVLIVVSMAGIGVGVRSQTAAPTAEQVKAARAVLAGTVTPDVALQRLGAFVQGLIQARIVAGIAPVLAPSTLKRKGGKSTPLILTAQLRSSIAFAVQAA